MKEKGKFIVIDGSDGSGKKTQSDLLIQALEKEGREIAYYDFPQYDKSMFGAMVGRYLNGEFGEADDVSPYISSLLYAGDRWKASIEMKKDLDQGKIVISNRYTQSNMAFQAAKIRNKKKKEEFLEWLTRLEFEEYGIPKPDLVIYLYMPYRVSQALVDKKNERNYTKMKRDIHEKNGDFLKRVEKEYLKLASENSEWSMVQCFQNKRLLSIEEIAGMVLQIVYDRLNISLLQKESLSDKLLNISNQTIVEEVQI